MSEKIFIKERKAPVLLIIVISALIIGFIISVFFKSIIGVTIVLIIAFIFAIFQILKNKFVSKNSIEIKVNNKQKKTEFLDEKIEKEKELKKFKKKIIIATICGILGGIIFFLIYRNTLIFVFSFAGCFCLYFIYEIVVAKLKINSRIKAIENVFPDFLQLMSSNLRAGMTIDRSLLLSAREEFAPLDEEILSAGKDITTGKTIESALNDMSNRIGSKKIEKIVLLIISGIKAGGNLATLLEETASDMREKDFIEKKAASNVLMYVIFIFLAVSVGAPSLFALSNVLVGILTQLLGSIPAVESSSSLPFSLKSINISTTFIHYFSLVFIIVTDFLASRILGLVSKGDENEGLKYFPAIAALSLGIFFAIKMFLSNFMAGFFS